MKRITGRYERTTTAGEDVDAFVPLPLPPAEPALLLGGEAVALLGRAEEGLRRLELVANLVPSLDWFIYAFVRKEAVLSSQIEGTQTTLVDLLTFEAQAGETPTTAADPDLQEVCNHLAALEIARDQLRNPDGLPISMRLLNDSHRVLMRGVRGANKAPGEIRRSQNWIGGTRPGNASFVPPPPAELPRVLSDLEKYIHADDHHLPALVRAGLVHVQFETIHPYQDGNGRIGRLLITLLLEHWRLLSQPLLYLSLFFKRHRDEYHRRLSAVRSDGDWEGWTRYFLEGVATITAETVASAQSLFAVVNRDRRAVLAEPSSSVAAARLFELLPRHPILTVAGAARLLETTKPTATKAIAALVTAGVLAERSGRKRDRNFGYSAYLDLLAAENAPA